VTLIKLTDIDDGIVIGLYEMPETLVSKLDEVLSGTEIGWQHAEIIQIANEDALRERFAIIACGHEPKEHLRGGCICGWIKGGMP
jgi:hypothetical protein